MVTTLNLELEEQKRWRLRSRFSGYDLFDKAAWSEFIPDDMRRIQLAKDFRLVSGFAARHVAYYRNLFVRLGITPGDFTKPGSLYRLPILTRDELQRHIASMQPKILPRGHKIVYVTRTSGSTGQPVHVPKTERCKLWWTILKQRELRWFRFDPHNDLAAIRDTRDLPRLPDGRYLPDDKTHSFPAWPAVGEFFETGRFLTCSHLCPLDQQIAWLQEQRPQYLMSMAANMEQLSFGYHDPQLTHSFRALLAISQELTPVMREQIEKTFAVPLHQNYGLNEIGIVASRCPEGGRYHVHSEHCLVEIVDEEGRPCQAGERGRILVTGLANLAMPLFRYDTGDLAEASEGPCVCGRTLPTFGAIHGRYRRIVFLPPGTWTLWTQVQRAMCALPTDLASHVRQYQLHQFHDGTFELRIVPAGRLPETFEAFIRKLWFVTDNDPPPPIQIVEVETIPRPPSRKFENFTSDFIPPRDG